MKNKFTLVLFDTKKCFTYTLLTNMIMIALWALPTCHSIFRASFFKILWIFDTEKVFWWCFLLKCKNITYSVLDWWLNNYELKPVFSFFLLENTLIFFEILYDESILLKLWAVSFKCLYVIKYKIILLHVNER